MTLVRPHKYLDAAKLEEWMCEHYPDVFEDWVCSEAIEWIDFWDWLADGEEYELFDEFSAWFNKERER